MALNPHEIPLYQSCRPWHRHTAVVSRAESEYSENYIKGNVASFQQIGHNPVNYEAAQGRQFRFHPDSGRWGN
jgi:hypothetical protein